MTAAGAPLPCLVELLDTLAASLAAGDSPTEEFLAQLRQAWLDERPDDAEALGALLSDLRAETDDRRISAAEEAHRQALRTGRSETQALRGPRRAGAGAGTPGRNQGWLYRVFFGTNRVRAREAGTLRFLAQRSETTTYGLCEVWVPATHRFGQIGRPWWQRWATLEFADDQLRLRETSVLPAASFWDSVRGEMFGADPGRRHGLVFIHGYNTSFEAAALRAAQVGFDLKVGGATAFFSWPSQATLRGYPADAASIEASEDALGSFLRDFATRSGAEVVHLIAHSMGNRGLLRALQRLASGAEIAAGVQFGQIFLAAPDVDRGLFLSLAALYPRFSLRTTLYASPADRAVRASAWLHANPRAGYTPPVTVAGIDRLDTVVVPDFDLEFLGHSYFARAEALLHDMFDQIVHASPPGSRQRLQPRSSQGSSDVYWEFDR